jgi:2-polyprenyl-6-hydroxyphenyl methylase/3-demethylubiquinone-9 3-methyltransferase
MAAKNAVDWHTEIASKFDKKYSTSDDFKERYMVWTAILDKYSDQDFNVFDIGCGSGIFSFYLMENNKNVTAIDASTEMLKICQKKLEVSSKKNIDFINCDISSLEDALDKKADMIICSSVLEYLDDLDDSLLLIKKLMKKNAIFIFSMPNKKSISRRIEPISFGLIGQPKYYKHVRNVCTVDDMDNRLKSMGFSILESEYYAKTPFLSRMFDKLGVSSHYSDNLFITVAQLSS